MTSLEVLAAASLALTGFVLRKLFPKRSEPLMKRLYASLFYVAIPATIFISVYNARDVEQMLSAIVLSLAHIALIFAISCLVATFIGKANKSLALAFSMAIAISNVAFLGIPLATIVLEGVEGIVPYVVAFNIAVPVLVLILSNLRGDSSSTARASAILKAIPFIAALLLALILKGLPRSVNIIPPGIPEAIALYTLSSFAIIGYEVAGLTFKSFKILFRWVICGVVIKYVVSPMLALALTSSLLNPTYQRGTLFESFMPPAVTSMILTKMFDLRMEVVSILMLLFTPLSVVLTSMLFYVFAW